MTDELDLELENEDESRNVYIKRINELTKKVKLTDEERAEKQHLLEERDVELGTVSKERDFFKEFSGNITKYPQATEYQDAIKDKVMLGYTVEDATVAVLAKEGKLTMETPLAPKENPAGGSAITNIGGGEKTISEMTRDEKRDALVEALGEKPLSQ